jgi:hypothetical protein
VARCQLAGERANVTRVLHEVESTVTREQHAQRSKEQDKLFIEAHPEFADRQQARELQERVARNLRDAGYSDEDVLREWNRPGSPLRDHRTQALLARAAKADATLENARAAKPLPKDLPPVQRPGMRQESRSHTATELDKLKRQMPGASRQEQLRSAPVSRLETRL